MDINVRVLTDYEKIDQDDLCRFTNGGTWTQISYGHEIIGKQVKTIKEIYNKYEFGRYVPNIFSKFNLLKKT